MRKRRYAGERFARYSGAPTAEGMLAGRLAKQIEKGDVAELNRIFTDLGFSENITALDSLRNDNKSIATVLGRLENAETFADIEILFSIFDRVSKTAMNVSGTAGKPREYFGAPEDPLYFALTPIAGQRTAAQNYMKNILKKFPLLPYAHDVLLAKAGREKSVNLFAGYVKTDDTKPFIFLDAFYGDPMQDFRLLESYSTARAGALGQEVKPEQAARHLSMTYGRLAVSKLTEMLKAGAKAAVQPASAYDNAIETAAKQGAPEPVIEALRMERDFLYRTR
ncbi:MAG: hypothetical protein HY513_02640 [Candidatus Aenigmarchaeota archaeon]|nr:hypothetical protein [Candidatus Aenigmarchaeota archaeon]